MLKRQGGLRQRSALRRFDGLRLWRRTPMARWAGGIATFALLFTGVLASASFMAHAFQGGHINSHSVALHERRPDHKAESNWFYLSHFGNSQPAPGARIQAMQQAAKLRRSPLGGAPHTDAADATVAGNTSVSVGSWAPQGPLSVDDSVNIAYCHCDAYSKLAGRVTAVAVNPNNSQDLWIGTTYGGVWHTTNATTTGADWTPMSDNQPSLLVGAIALDPNNPATVYVGTGEANVSGTTYGGIGILKSTDGGAHWTQLGFTQFAGLGIAKIAVDPNNTSNILVATAPDSMSAPLGGADIHANLGLWRSTNGGINWAEVLADTSSPPGATHPDAGTDVLFDPAHPGIAFAGLGNTLQSLTSSAGMYKSSDSGASWTRLTSGLPSGADVEHVSIGISQDGQHIYVALTDAGVTDTAAGGHFGAILNGAIYTSTDNGATWAASDVSNVYQ